MHAVPVTIRGRHDAGLTPGNVEGFVPYADSPLAVTLEYVHDDALAIWTVRKGGGWQIVHRATGLHLGGKFWPTRDEAMAALMKCEPEFPAWAAAIGSPTDAATIACRGKFRAVRA